MQAQHAPVPGLLATAPPRGNRIDFDPVHERDAELGQRIGQVEARIAALAATLERVRRHNPGGGFAELRRTLDGARELLAQMQRTREHQEAQDDS